MLRIGSMFSGSGGFELAGALNGVEPVWCSEIEPYPIAVTRSRFPSMKHYGDVSKVNGAEVEPVDIITFGSPCQDLSIAGKREGIEDGARSSLFFQAVRIIKEMRDVTNGVYPNYAVWENVPGAFSSNHGNDFRLVLEALASISDPTVSIPMPEKWQRAGEIVGNGWSIAWRTLDAQYWGVPQRRKRIYLVADFASERAGEILFEPESVRGDTAPSGTAREGTTDNVDGSAGRSGVRCLNSDHPQSSRIYDADGIYPCLSSNASGGLNRQAVCYPAGDAEGSVGGSCGAFCAGASPLARSIGYDEHVSPTLKSASAGLSMHAVVYPAIARTLEHRYDSSPCIDRGQNVICLQANGIDRADTAGCNGAGWRENESYTLNTVDRHAVCYEPKSALEENWAESEVKNALRAEASKSSHAIVTYQDCVGALCATDYKWVQQQQQQVEQDKLVVHKASNPLRKYIVRRLTPTECARLQGFPDAWGELAPYDGDDAFWQGVYKTSCEIKGGKYTPKKGLRKWYNGLHTDSAEYKMWGNGIALPCAEYVIRSIKRRAQ